MSASGAWTDEAVLGESERWVHVPRGSVLVSDERRLLVHLPRRWAASRVWRSWPADEEQASDLIGETIGEARAAGSKKLVWHTGDRVSPPYMDGCLARRGFGVAEELEVLAFELGDGPEPALPRLGVPSGVHAELVRDAGRLREALLVDSEVFSSPSPSGD